MSPRPSNRDELREAALRCLGELPAEQVTSRAIAAEAGGTAGSIAYHFGSKDVLVAEAAVLGLDRWLDRIAERLADVEDPVALLRGAAALVSASHGEQRVLVANYVAALARASHDEVVRARLADGFRHARSAVATLLQSADEEEDEDVSGLLLAMFHGLLIQMLVDPSFDPPPDRLDRALDRLGDLLR